MEIVNPLICVVTPKSVKTDTTSYESINAFNINAQFVLDNRDALSTVYNRVIADARASNIDCLIFTHDDIILEENPIPKLETLFDDFDLVGVAGASKIELTSPALWHLMGGGFGGGNLHGRIQHTGNGGKPLTEFGPCPHRVVVIDGVLMALNRHAIESLRFDEDCPSKFHFYDCILSVDAALRKIKVGVGDILITHESPGLKEFTSDWLDGEKYFLNKYGK